MRAKQINEDTYGVQSPRRNRGFDKYETEIHLAGTVLVKKGFTTTDPIGMGQYSTDLLEIHQIFAENLKTYFMKRISGIETSSLKLKKVNFTNTEKERSQSIEMKTKEEIILIILEILDSSEMDDKEKESIKSSVKKSKPKQFLVNMFNELMEDRLHENLELSLDI